MTVHSCNLDKILLQRDIFHELNTKTQLYT